MKMKEQSFIYILNFKVLNCKTIKSAKTQICSIEDVILTDPITCKVIATDKESDVHNSAI
jgi:hypothetical protein